ncbi:MAG: EAL domain-containing protein [Spirochaetes bacterium]|nr:MAG: EAL domain-containing protein [Spirochaetota bacterium]
MNPKEITLALIDLTSGKGGRLRGVLAGSGYGVREESVESAGERVKTGGIDALIVRSDAKDSLAQQVKSLGEAMAGADIPLIVMMPRFTLELALYEVSRNLHHITTPCRAEHLLDRIRGILEGRTQSRARSDTHETPVEVQYRGARYVTPGNARALLGGLLRNADDSIHNSAVLREMLSTYSKIDADSMLVPELDWKVALTPEENALCEDMLASIGQGRFELYYQPIIHLASGRISGFEALIRWNHPVKGFLPPGDFIGLAERTDIVIPLGYWIMGEASRQLAELHALFPSDPPLYVSVNVSARQFIREDLCERIEKTVDANGLPHESLRLELTESAFMENKDSANLMLLTLKSKNFLLYMDDFGTGYSSLSYLMHFPVDVLKIDQSFVKWMHVDEESEEIVRSVVALAHNLKRRVVAEGVDNEGHIELLRSLSCDYGQGYFFSKPLAFSTLKELLTKNPSW